ncbi:MAG: Signal peptidase peptidase [Pseudomonadota bacterium]
MAATPPFSARPSRRRVAALAAVALTALAGWAARHVAVVPDDEMAPTLMAGDLAWIVDGPLFAGDVVSIVDPLDPSRFTFRRVESTGGAIRYAQGVFLTGTTPRVREMGELPDPTGRGPGWKVRQEADHLVRHRAREVRSDMEVRTVPDDAVFLGADARDDALDSRWWGPLPRGAVQGRAAFRVGPPRHRWRGWFGRP